MKTVDLHTHTTCSDGTFTPKELVEYAAKKGLSAIAITDHDVFSGVEEGIARSRGLGIEVIPGIEVSAEYEGSEVHIVGLFIDIYNKAINNKLENMRKKRIDRNRLMAEKLRELGIDISYDDIKNAADGEIVTRAHIAKALRQKGYVASNQEAFDKYIGTGKAAYVKRDVLDWQETINMINNAGGAAILAHPLLYKFSQNRLENIAADMSAHGLKGIEAYYPTHSLSDVKYIKLIAEKNNIKISGGSDFHGKNKPRLDLGAGYGDLAVPYEVLEGIKGVI